MIGGTRLDRHRPAHRPQGRHLRGQTALAVLPQWPAQRKALPAAPRAYLCEPCAPFLLPARLRSLHALMQLSTLHALTGCSNAFR